MERMWIIGLVGGTILLVIGMYITSFNMMLYADLASVFITFGGAVFGTFIATPWARMKKFFKLMAISSREMKIDPSAIVETLVTFAEKSRREGVLSLEEDVRDISDSFLKKAIQLVVDGTDPDIVKNIMYNEISQMEERHEQHKKIFDDMAYLLPAFGMIGTLIGLVAMLANLEDKSMIGPSMAVALITTLYGAIGANFILIPMASRLSLYSKLETLMKEITVEGVLSIQAGDNPTILRERLNSFIPESSRAVITKEKDTLL